jgi:predicted nucleic acid-binding protein
VTVLPDTSIWIDYLSDQPGLASEHLDGLLQDREVMTCGPVIAEILAGTPAELRPEVWSSIGSLPWADLPPEAWRRIGERLHDLVRKGGTVPLTDMAIAMAAVEGDAALWTRDKDFRRIKEVLPKLELYLPEDL